MVLLDALGERWTLRILWDLRAGPLTFRELVDSTGGLSPTLLNKRLKMLRDLDLVAHEGSGYFLTKQGVEHGELLLPLSRWPEHWTKRLRSRQQVAEKVRPALFPLTRACARSRPSADFIRP